MSLGQAEHPALFVAPAKEQDPGKRALAVLKWFLSTLKQQYSSRSEKLYVRTFLSWTSEEKNSKEKKGIMANPVFSFSGVLRRSHSILSLVNCI